MKEADSHEIFIAFMAELPWSQYSFKKKKTGDLVAVEVCCYLRPSSSMSTEDSLIPSMLPA